MSCLHQKKEIPSINETGSLQCSWFLLFSKRDSNQDDV
jgi:hypothetical protein